MTGEHGGAAFILIYLVAILLLGYSLVVNEMVLGRAASVIPWGSLRLLPRTVPGEGWALLIRYVVPVLIFFIMALGIYETFFR
jgi:SNF family Na+-dependent transporter